MRARSRILICVAAATAIASASSSALADDTSAQGPAYVQGSVGVNYWDFPDIRFTFLIFTFTGSYSWSAFRPDIEIGYHPSGRHDGLAFGLRQAFYVDALQGHAAAATILRVGYDLPYRVGQLEVNVDPFATFGIGYIFDNLHAGIAATGGIDVKLFVTNGVYVMARPAELGIQCFHDVGFCAFSYAASAGAGFAFGGR